MPRELLVMMGVSGCGKTTVGSQLARALALPFIEGDALHSASSIEKMRRGEPLDDADRAPWLAAIARELADEARYPAGLVVACSALKRAYRDTLRAAATGVRFVFLDARRSVIERRVAARRSHFMPRSLVASQFETLERPTAAEPDVITLHAGPSPAAIVDALLGKLSAARAASEGSGTAPAGGPAAFSAAARRAARKGCASRR